ncbi:MAG: LamG-like jellyroll fold domain-containing protein, partial [Planctomycetota bacterium]
ARVAKVAAADFTHGIDGHTPVAEGVPMPAGRYNLLAGLIELEYASGARLVIQAPADFQLVDDQTVGLSSGRLAAHVPEPAAGFVVETAGGRIIDLGTAFGVEADESNGTAIYVFDGEVSVEPAGRVPQDEKRLTLVGGTATRIDSVTGTPAGIAFDDQKILRSFSNGQSRYSAGVRALGPTLYYEMEPTPSGSILYDTSSAPQPSQHAGHTAWIAGDANRSVLWCAGKVGTAIEMHGPRDGTWIAAPDYPRAEQDALSIVAWVYAETRPMWASIAKNWGESTCGQAHLGLRGYGGELAAHITDRNGQEVAAVDTAPLPLHSWQHVAMVVEGDELRLYRNGERVASTATDGLGVNPSLRKLAIGCKLNDEESGPVPFGQWDGRLDELAVFNKALSDAQVLSLYRLVADEQRVSMKPSAGGQQPPGNRQ